MKTSTIKTATSHCANCGVPVRWECKPTDAKLNNEFCSVCATPVTKLLHAEMKGRIAETTLGEQGEKNTAESRAIKSICRNRIIESETERKIALDQLHKIKMLTRPETEEAAIANKFLYLT